jgi:hypothetical protein
MPYIGFNPTNAGSFIELDDIASTFNGSGDVGTDVVAFTLQVGSVSITPNIQNLLIMLDGVVQQPTSAFNVSGSTITFTEAPQSGVDFYGVLMGQSASVGGGTIGADELKVSGDGSNGQVLTSDGDGTFSWATDAEDYVPLAGGTMTGTLAMGSNNITSTGTITGTLGTASQTAITGVGTITTGVWNAGAVTSSGAITSNSGQIIMEGVANGTSTYIQLKNTSTTIGYVGCSDSIIGSAGDSSDVMVHSQAGNVFLASANTLALTLDSSQNATFAGAVISTKAGQTYSSTGTSDASGVFKGVNTNSSSGYAMTLALDADGHANADDIVRTRYLNAGSPKWQHNVGADQIWYSDVVGNGSWVEKFKIEAGGNATFAGVVSFPDGSASAPSITNTGDTNTGFYFGAANEVHMTLDGAQQWRWSGQQLGAINGANPGYPAYTFGADWNTGMYLEGADILAFSTGGTKRFDLNASGNATFTGIISQGNGQYTGYHNDSRHIGLAGNTGTNFWKIDFVDNYGVCVVTVEGGGLTNNGAKSYSSYQVVVESVGDTCAILHTVTNVQSSWTWSIVNDGSGAFFVKCTNNESVYFNGWASCRVSGGGMDSSGSNAKALTMDRV